MNDTVERLLANPSLAAQYPAPDLQLCEEIIRRNPSEAILFQLLARFADPALLDRVRPQFSRALQESIDIMILEGTTDPVYLKRAEALLKSIQQPAKLARAQIAYLNLLYVNKHIVKAASIAQAVRASAVHLQPYVQGQLDLISAKISQASGDYFQAVGYYQEALPQLSCAVELILCKLLSQQFHEIEKIAQKYFNEKTKLCVQLAGVLRTKEHMYLQEVQRICQLLDCELATSLLEREIEQFIKKALQFYEKVEISHISEISGVEERIIEKLVEKMILNGDLNFYVDGNSGVLHRTEVQTEESVYVLRKAIEVVTALHYWI